MAININTIITDFDRLYPANNDQIWRILKRDNLSLTDEIIEQLDINFTEQTITITAKSTSTEYTGSVSINSYQYNLYLSVDDYGYFVYDFNQLCHTGETFNVRTNTGDKTFTTNSEFATLEFIENPSINFIGDNFLKSCKKINSLISIPVGITSIGNYFLYNCENFNLPLIIANSVTTIGNRFLQLCKFFNSQLTLSNSLTSIGTYFMYGCENFNQSLIIPNSVTIISNSFLNGCSSFNQPLTLSNTLSSIGGSFMNYCSSFNQPLTLPDSLTYIGNNFLTNCSSFNQPLVISNSVTIISNSFLDGCSSFNKALTLSNSLTSIGDNFLNGCSSFNQPLTLSNTLSSIGGSFMNYCSSFNQPLTLPDSLSSIGIYFMYGCNNFSQKLTISDSITPQMFASSSSSFATSNSSATVYTEGFKIKYDKFDQLLARFPKSNTNPYRNIVVAQTSFIAKETSLSYKYHLNLVLGEHDIKVYLVKENEVSMQFNKPITTILPDTSTGKLLIGNALKNLPKDQLTETAIETKITAINFYNK